VTESEYNLVSYDQFFPERHVLSVEKYLLNGLDIIIRGSISKNFYMFHDFFFWEK